MVDAIAELIKSYYELNSATVDELSEMPSALEFLRYVAVNRPFIVRGGAEDWKAVRCWDAQYLRRTLGNQPVNVSTTPLGNADAVVKRPDGSLIFVEPCDADEPFSDFLHYVQLDSGRLHPEGTHSNVKYAQTQNDNLRDEYRCLFEDVPSSIDFARIALDKEPDAVNLWLGNSRSVTAIHKDNYENIYVQVRGQKHFTLLPPIAMPCMNEQPLPQARYQTSSTGQLELVVNEEAGLLPVAVWDPDEPATYSTIYSHLAQPHKVTLQEGDMLYLPAMWYHKVSQTEGDDGFACAVNYWYDMEFSGSFWTTNSFIRDITNGEANVSQ